MLKIQIWFMGQTLSHLGKYMNVINKNKLF